MGLALMKAKLLAREDVSGAVRDYRPLLLGEILASSHYLSWMMSYRPFTKLGR
jgi:hypothetical protein